MDGWFHGLMVVWIKVVVAQRLRRWTTNWKVKPQHRQAATVWVWIDGWLVHGWLGWWLGG